MKRTVTEFCVFCREIQSDIGSGRSLIIGFISFVPLASFFFGPDDIWAQPRVKFSEDKIIFLGVKFFFFRIVSWRLSDWISLRVRST